MQTQFLPIISRSLNISEKQIANTIKLLEEGATIPFISRYRKEATGALDEVNVAAIKDANDKLNEISKRKETILSTIQDLDKLTPELKTRIENCWDSTELEDIYLPFKPKRRTKAEIAREKGLEPLATFLLFQNPGDVTAKAKQFVKGEVKDEEDALKGARDIIAEIINEDERARNQIRNVFAREAVITSKVVKGKEEEGNKYKDYFEWSEPLKRCSSHRMLALRRGENEGFLRVSISPEDENCLERLQRIFVKRDNEAASQVETAMIDAYKRLLKPSIETEFANLSKEKADEEAIRVFAQNLNQLLLAAPLGQKRVLAIDPGYRTGCKVV